MILSYQTIFDIILRVLIVYAVVLIGIRLSGKREVGQMTPFDFVLLLLIANAVQNAMVGPDTSLMGGLLAAITLIVANVLVTKVIWKNKRIRAVIEGTPTVLISKGKVLQQNLTNERISQEILEEALREHGVKKRA